MMIKLILSRFIIALMMLSAVSIVVPVYMGIGNASAGNAVSINSQNNISSSCHFNQSSISPWCCYSDCHFKYAPFFFTINTWQEIHSRPFLNIPAIRLQRVYLKLVTPPPIIS